MSASHVATVRGPVDPSLIGRTLIHEHVHSDLRPLLIEHGYAGADVGEFDCCTAGEARWNPGAHVDNYDLTDIDLVSGELAALHPVGVNCVVDATPIDLGRNAEALLGLAEATSLHIVMGAGWYLEATHARHIVDWSDGEIVEQIVRDCTVGVDGTTITSGIIGEIGTNDPVTRSELRVVRAAAEAASQTGRALTIHLHPWGRQGRRVLQEIGVTRLGLARVLLNHLNTAAHDLPYLQALLDEGANIAFDLFGFDHSLLGQGRYPPSDWDVAETVALLVRSGYGEQLFLSQDIGVRTRLKRYGGWGYDHLVRHVVPLLRQFGVADAEAEQLLVENPRRLLTVAC